MTWVAAMIGDLLPVDHRGVRREGLGGVLADADHRIGRLRPGGEGHLQPGLTAVLAVVVGLGDEGDAGRLEGGQGGRRGVEVVGLGLGVGTGPVGHGGLEIDHAEVAPDSRLRTPVPRAVVGSAASRSPSVLPEGKLTSPPKAKVTARRPPPVRLEPWVGDRVGRGPGPGVVTGGGVTSAAAQTPTRGPPPARPPEPPAIVRFRRGTRRDTRSGPSGTGPPGSGGTARVARPVRAPGRSAAEVGDRSAWPDSTWRGPPAAGRPADPARPGSAGPVGELRAVPPLDGTPGVVRVAVPAGRQGHRTGWRTDVLAGCDRADTAGTAPVTAAALHLGVAGRGRLGRGGPDSGSDGRRRVPVGPAVADAGPGRTSAAARRSPGVGRSRGGSRPRRDRRHRASVADLAPVTDGQEERPRQEDRTEHDQSDPDVGDHGVRRAARGP